MISTMFGKRTSSGGGEKKEKTECLASFALFIFFFLNIYIKIYTLNLNIILLSVYLNFLLNTNVRI